MTPVLALLLFLLAVSVGVLCLEVRDIRAEDRLWRLRRAKLLGLNRYTSTRNPIDHKRAIENALFFGWAPGAQWIVDPSQVQVLARPR